MQGKLQKWIVPFIGAAIALCVCFLLCRFVFFQLHGMKAWPLYLFILGIAVIAVSAFTHSGKVMIGTVVGYMAGFVLAMLLRTDGIDPGGGATNNAWIIWTFSFLLFILAGVVWEVVSKRAKTNNPQ
jgi:membrane-bound ClpP family serine protease